MIAAQVAERAEALRTELAKLWLGQELPPWHTSCPLHVHLTPAPPSGATTFTFGHDRAGQGRVFGMRMEISGQFDRLIASVLPHEITHTILAHHFRQPVPRWADEGASVCAEDSPEQHRHHLLMIRFLHDKKHIPLRDLFALKEYPPNVHALYAGGFSISKFLIEGKGRRVFLRFVADGMKNGWKQATRQHYPFHDVEEMEESWLGWVRLDRTMTARIRLIPALCFAQHPGIASGVSAISMRYPRLLR
jgi:hypothetical protein